MGICSLKFRSPTEVALISWYIQNFYICFTYAVYDSHRYCVVWFSYPLVYAGFELFDPEERNKKVFFLTLIIYTRL